MASQAEDSLGVSLEVENIGGIDKTEVEFGHGVTILSGENATNRTSLLQAIMAALGSENVSLKADATKGHVELTTGSQSCSRTLERKNGRIDFSGDPYLEDPELGDLFAFLLESNPTRQAIASQREDLREVIMQPVDTAKIEADISQFEAKKRQLDEKIDELESLKNQLPNLESKKRDLDSQIAKKQKELDSIKQKISSMEVDVEDTQEQKEALESKLGELKEVRSSLDQIEHRLETEQDSIEAAETQRSRLQDELADLPESVADERESLQSKINSLRAEKSQRESEISELQNLIQFNEDRLSGNDHAFLGERPNSGTEEITAQLTDGETVTCWTCGTEVERSRIEKTVDTLRELRASKLDRISELDEEISQLSTRLDDLEGTRQEREQRETRIEELTEEITSRRADVTDLRSRQEELESQLHGLEGEIEDLEIGEIHNELLELHQEANRLELEIEDLRDRRADVEDEITEIEQALGEQEDLRNERDSVSQQLTDLRNRVKDLEQAAIGEFNDRMAEILDIMDYENIERIWIERKTTDHPGDHIEESEFELHVVRGDESGVAYEDSVEHLSESEREVTGLIFALAGYLVHDGSDEVPFMLLDSVEALDGSRIAKLVDYFEQHTEYLIIALLPEDASALDDTYERVTDI